MKDFKDEKTFVMLKPDGVKKGLTGEVIKRIEQRDLKVIALKMFKATYDQIDNHYPKDETWISRLGTKTLATYEKYGVDPIEELGTNVELEIGQMVRKWLVEYMTSAPLVKMVVKGPHAVDIVRKLAGPTLPVNADCGTIRGDYSVDSPALANREKRAVYNIMHASETPEEAEHEIKHWITDDELCDY